MVKVEKKIIVANWKMNPEDLAEAENIFNFTLDLSRKTENAEIIICPPHIYLQKLNSLNSKQKIKLGAQNCFFEKKGAYTGEISPVMLKNLNCEFVIIGHSERKIHLCETDTTINKKIKSALKSGLKPIFCVGEYERDENMLYFNILKNQIENGLKEINKSTLKNIIIAYEPVWAISANKNAEAADYRDIYTITAFIRKTLFNMFKTKLIFEIKILYGGSVDKNNFKNFLSIEDVSGFLIGGVSLKQGELKEILENV